jgi:hypothetical protein
MVVVVVPVLVMVLVVDPVVVLGMVVLGLDMLDLQDRDITELVVAVPQVAVVVLVGLHLIHIPAGLEQNGQPVQEHIMPAVAVVHIVEVGLEVAPVVVLAVLLRRAILVVAVEVADRVTTQVEVMVAVVLLSYGIQVHAPIQ